MNIRNPHYYTPVICADFHAAPNVMTSETGQVHCAGCSYYSEHGCSIHLLNPLHSPLFPL